MIKPAKYDNLSQSERRELRNRYMKEQHYVCPFCGLDLRQRPEELHPELVKQINWKRFPKHFLKYPVHLHHNHITGLTIGAYHSICNAILFDKF